MTVEWTNGPGSGSGVAGAWGQAVAVWWTAVTLACVGCTGRPVSSGGDTDPASLRDAGLLVADLAEFESPPLKCGEGPDFSARFLRSSIDAGVGAMVSIRSRPARLPGLVGFGSGMFVRRNDGRGVLGPREEIAPGVRFGSLAVADFDADGESDIVTTLTHYVVILRGLGHWRFESGYFFEQPDLNTPFFLGSAAADINRDGLPDLVCTPEPTVFMNRGRFQFEVLAYPRNTLPPLLLEDLNGDGWPDFAAIALYQPPGEESYPARRGLAVSGNLRAPPYLNEFSDFDSWDAWSKFPLSRGWRSRQQGPATIAVDFDGDGRRDLATAFDEGFDLMRNRTMDGTFAFERHTARGAGRVTELAAGDLNRDGRLDFVSGSEAHCVNVWLGEANGTFRWGVLSMPGPMPHILVDDFNGDGWPDIVANEWGGPMDGSPPTNRWYQHAWTNLGKW